MRVRFISALTVILSALSYAPLVSAQEDPEPAEVESEEAPEGDEAALDGAEGAEEEAAPAEDRGAAADAAAEELTSPVEKKGETYKFVGLRYRGLIVPQFMQSLFGADGGTTVYAHSFGPEFILRKDNFEYDFALTYASYAMDPTPFKAKSDAEDAWELVESQIKVLYLTADFLWSHSFNPQFALNYGIGAGLGIVWGDLIREQAYRDPASGDLLPCVGPGNPPVANYCGSDNDHYDGYTEPSWADGGSKPIIMPWLAVQAGIRFKPHRNFQAHLHTGIGVGHVFFGLGADYGL